MAIYQFITHTYMKSYNADRFWIVPDYIGDYETEADDVETARKSYFDFLESNGVTISKNAKRPANIGECFRGKIRGKVYTGRTLIADRSANYYGYQYIDVFSYERIIREV